LTSGLINYARPNHPINTSQELADLTLAQRGTHHFRITHHRDPVPHLPPRTLGFVHEGVEVFYPAFAADDGAYVVCNKVCVCVCVRVCVERTERSEWRIGLG
jgi:hypothetical protein